MLVDLVGVGRISHAFGMFIMTTGFGIILGSPLTGEQRNIISHLHKILPLLLTPLVKALWSMFQMLLFVESETPQFVIFICVLFAIITIKILGE